MPRWILVSILGLLLCGSLSSCATTSPLAVAKEDRQALVGTWEEEWPGAAVKDTYRIEIKGETVDVVPVSEAKREKVRMVQLLQKRLTFFLDLEDGPVYYDLVLVSPKVLTGRAKGGPRKFDEPVRWYKKD